MVKIASVVLAATVSTAQAGDCYCSCCNWCHMSECFDGHSCCDDSSCSGCGTLEADIAYNASIAAKLEEVAVKVALEAEAAVTGSGCWNSQHSDAAGNWGWCEDCSGGFSRCCYADYTYGCDGGENCKCENDHILPYLEEAAVKEQVSLEAEVAVTGTGCWNSQHADAAGKWGWCDDCSGGFHNCCHAEYVHGCDGGENCKCDPAHYLPSLEAAVKEEVSLEAAAEAEAETDLHCQCSCCGWCYMANCYDGYACCGESAPGKGDWWHPASDTKTNDGWCSTCSSFEDMTV